MFWKSVDADQLASEKLAHQDQLLFSTLLVNACIKNYIHANKKKTIQFCENKYRHEHVMITNLYIVNHILYGCHLY